MTFILDFISKKNIPTSIPTSNGYIFYFTSSDWPSQNVLECIELAGTINQRLRWCQMSCD